MPHARTAALVLGALVATAVVGAGCGHSAAQTAGAPAGVAVSMAAEPRPAAAQSASAQVALTDAEPPADARSPAGAERLEAVRTVALYCHLIEAGQFARAGELCARRRLWSRRALAGVSRFRFRSARVYAAPDARTLVLKARVRVHAGRGRPLPDGLAILFFTLGRAGSSVGRWLISAVATSP